MIKKLDVYTQKDGSFKFEFYSNIDVDILSMIDLCTSVELDYKEYFTYTENLRSVAYYHLCIHVRGMIDWIKLKRILEILDVCISSNYDILVKNGHY